MDKNTKNLTCSQYKGLIRVNVCDLRIKLDFMNQITGSRSLGVDKYI